MLICSCAHLLRCSYATLLLCSGLQKHKSYVSVLYCLVGMLAVGAIDLCRSLALSSPARALSIGLFALSVGLCCIVNRSLLHCKWASFELSFPCALDSCLLFSLVPRSEGMQWANFDVWPDSSRRSLEAPSGETSLKDPSSEASVYDDRSPYTADDLYRSEGLAWERCPDFSTIVAKFWQRLVSPPPATL